MTLPHRQAAAVGVGLLVLVIVLDRTFSSRGLWYDGPPESSWPYLLRAAALAIVGLTLAIGARGWVAEHLAVADDRQPGSGFRAVTAAWAGSALLALGPGVLHLIDRDTYRAAAEEDSWIEWASAGLLFLGGAVVLVAALLWYRRRQRGDPWLPIVALVGLSGLLVVIGAEEISWGLRYLDKGGPAWLVSHNQQGEPNFHNIHTGFSSNLYYTGSFLFLVVTPFLLHGRRVPKPLRSLESLKPPLAVLAGSVVTAAIVAGLWDQILIQLTFWFSLGVVLATPRTGVNRVWAPASVPVLVATLAIFLSSGAYFADNFNDAELRELLIPYGLFIYALCVLQVARQPAEARAPAEAVV